MAGVRAARAVAANRDRAPRGRRATLAHAVGPMELRALVATLPQVDVAIGYGSGVFRQVGYRREHVAEVAFSRVPVIVPRPPRTFMPGRH